MSAQLRVDELRAKYQRLEEVMQAIDFDGAVGEDLRLKTVRLTALTIDQVNVAHEISRLVDWGHAK